MSYKKSVKPTRKLAKPHRKSKNHDSEGNDSEDADADKRSGPRKTKYAEVWLEDDDSLSEVLEEFDEKDEVDAWAVAQEPSPLKRKRGSNGSATERQEDSDVQTPSSLNDLDLADLDDSEDDLDIERFEGEALIQEEEDRQVLQSKFHVVDDVQPFAYAPDEESDHTSNTEEFWIEDFDALVGNSAVFENMPVPKFQLRSEETAETTLEDEFFLGYISSDNDGDDVDDEGDDEPTIGMDDDDDRVGWECFFSDGSSQSDAGDDEASSGGTTDDETPEVIIARHKASKVNPVTPAKTPAKTNLTSCLKQTHVYNEDTPSKSITSTPIKLNTSHQPPVLGTWARDSRKPTGIIDGLTTHSPAGASKILAKPPKKVLATYKRSDAMTEAMTSLDDIMYTNDFVVPQAKVVPSKFDRPIQVGAFRKGQQRSSMIQESFFREEWYNMTSRNKEKPGRTKATPILGVASESLSRKEKRRRKKMRAAAGMSVGGSTFGGSIDELSDSEYNDGIERAGLGLGVPVESLFLFHDC